MVPNLPRISISYSLKRFTAFAFLLCAIASICLSQEKVNLAVGLGYPNGLSPGIRFQFPQTQIALSFDPGILAYFNTDNRSGKFTYYTVSGGIYRHVFGRSRMARRKPWFIKAGATYFQGEDAEKIRYQAFFDAMFGRDLHFTDRLGMSIATGIFYKFREDYKAKDPDYFEFTETGIGVPIEFAMFYRFRRSRK